MPSRQSLKVYIPCIISVIAIVAAVAGHRYFDTDKGTLSDALVCIAAGIVAGCWTFAYASWKSPKS